jgi:hypothetical protein
MVSRATSESSISVRTDLTEGKPNSAIAPMPCPIDPNGSALRGSHMERRRSHRQNTGKTQHVGGLYELFLGRRVLNGRLFWTLCARQTLPLAGS